MLQFIINNFILIMSLLFSQMTHPLSMGLMLLIQTLLISLLIGLMSKTFWFSYTLFLIFLGGMLVMFIYVSSLSSNEMFTISKKLLIFMSILMVTTFFTFMIIDMPLLQNIFNYETSLMNNFNMFLNEDYLNLNKLYNYSTNFITLFLINYLFLTLVISVKITNFFYGPLRPSF